jgi:sugar/nucleoside kinase (ribokinase family)
VGSPDFLVIGHVSMDRVEARYRPGGTVTYSALTAQGLGRKVAVITSAGPDLNPDELFRDIEVLCVPSPVTTTFVNIYEADLRHQHIEAVADKILSASVSPHWRHTPVVHLGPIADEFDEDMIDLFPGSLLGLTPQGWLRQWDSQGRVSPRQWRRAARFLQRIDALFVSEEDLAGEASLLRSQLHLPRMAVVTEGAEGATLHYQDHSTHIAPRKTRAVDPTGAGDVFAAAFLVRLAETDDPPEAARFASVAASLSVEKTGFASVPSRAQIEAHLTGTP